MGSAKTKTTIVATIACLALGTGLFVVSFAASSRGAARRQVLSDGSVLVLNRVQVDAHVSIRHGTQIAKLLGNLVPSNGVHLLHVNLDRATQQIFDSQGKSWLVAEFKLVGPN